MREVLEASRGARLVINSQNENVFLNSRFRALCKPYGFPSYQSLLAIFGDKKSQLEDMAVQARAGQIQSLEIDTVAQTYR